MGPLNNEGIKRALRNDKAIAEKLKHLFALVFTTKDTREIPMPNQSFLVDVSEELDHIVITIEVLE